MTVKYLIVAFLIIGVACKDSMTPPNSISFIANPPEQADIFKKLTSITAVPESELNDSLAFLVLPVKLSCPACRRKTIDSIVKHQDDLLKGHYIVISSSESRRNMRAYFQEVDKEMPVIEKKLYLDTIHQAYKIELVTENPVIYYTANQKAYKKVSAIPATVRDDLREFFSGTRNTISKK